MKLNYGESEILQPKDIDLISSGCNIISVDLVYTDFQERDHEMLLNRQRLTELYFLYPDIYKQPMIQWRLVKQLGFSTEDEARKLFHGFVITYRKLPPMVPMGRESLSENSDSSLYRVLETAKIKTSDLIAIDLTGSMSPYSRQIMRWLSLRSGKDTLSYSFFNDGDNKSDHVKRAGSTGGIYLERTADLDSVMATANRCIRGGGGGDAQENNIEAVLKGLNIYKSTKRVIMVADNWAPMRDYGMISDVKKPVFVILCGTEFGGYQYPPNPQYLDLARATGGSVHTMEEDLESLVKLKEGQTITFGGFTYQIQSGKFVLKGPASKPIKS